MASETITLNKSASSGNYIQAKVVWESAVNNSANNSDVTARVYVRKDNDSLLLTIPTSGTWNYTLSINGKSFSGSVSKSVLLDWVLLGTHSVQDIAHGDDGNKTITISGSVTAPTGTGLNGHTSSGSGSAKMDTVPRATSIDAVSCSTNYFDGKITFRYTPQSGNFYNRCNIALNRDGEYLAVKTINLGKKTAGQQTGTVTLTQEEQAIIYNALPNTSKGKLRFTFRTYSDSGYSNQVGSPVYKEIDLLIPGNENTLPDPGATLASLHSLGQNFNGVYVQGKSKVKATFSGKGKYGATIKSYDLEVASKSYGSAESYTSDYLANYGEITVKTMATDSRGYTGIVTHKIQVLPYAKPKVMPISGQSEIVCARCDSEGNLSDAGTCLRVKAKRSYSKCVDAGGTQRNFCGIRVRYKVEGGSYTAWKTLLAATNLSTDQVDSGAIYKGELLVTKTYIAQVDVVDSVGNHTSYTASIPTDKVAIHEAGSIGSMGIGKYAEDPNTVDIAEDKTVRVRGELKVGDRTISDTGWISLGLASGIEEASLNTGRNGQGCFYRVVNGNHVYVAFDCAFTYDGSAASISANDIPEPYRPVRNVYGLNVTNGRGVARSFVNSSGTVRVDYVQNMAAAEVTNEIGVNWIDGYIDYWV